MIDNQIAWRTPDTNLLAALRSNAADQPDESVALRLEAHLRQPRYRNELTRVAMVDGDIAGYVLVDHRRVRIGAAMIDAGVLADVFVTLRWRESALFEHIVGAYLGTLYEQGLPLALVGDRPQDELEPYGLAPFLLDAQVDFATQGTETTEERVATAVGADRDDLAALYEATYAGLPIAEVRTPADWRALIPSQPGLLALHDRAGRVVAYARLDRAAVVEAAAVDAGMARSLVKALLNHGRSTAIAVTLALSVAHPVAQAAMQLAGVLRLATHGTRAVSVPLAGIVDLPAMLTALVPELEQRIAHSRYAGWSGGVRIELGGGRATLLADHGRLSVVDGTRPADVRLRNVALPALAQLLLGYRGPGDLRATGGLDCDDIALGLLDALFPVLGACRDATPFL